MEKPDVKKERFSPPLNGYSDKTWSNSRDSMTTDDRNSGPRTPTSLQNERVQQILANEHKYVSQTPPTESHSDSDNQDIKEETSPDPSATPSTSAVLPPTAKQKSSSKKSAKAPVQLIGHFPRAEKEAYETFEELNTNWHQYKYLGKSKIQEDAMACECQYRPGDPIDRACGPHSDCINRLTLVECIDGECRCHSFCQNQRFQKRQYADVHVVKTEMKGFGLRAGSLIRRDEFIYEYIGEVVNEQILHRRMASYGDEGIEHFYFMMLQKDEFIDATKKGGIGRFANHSCNPNCYVARWVVDGRLRMGIFAKREIQKNEELTFNYNADRYGHEAQKCYCGEPNCIGYIGGKTQTDLGGMDELYIDALGIADEVEALGLKGNKKKKGKKLDEDFNPVLKPMVEEDVPKVLNAIKQTTTRNILTKLVERIRLTEDQAVLRQIVRLRGLSTMRPTLEEYKEDLEVQILIMETVEKWPFPNRNKVEDSGIERVLQDLKNTSEDGTICSLCERLLLAWSKLEVVYRIPRTAPIGTTVVIEADRHELDDRPTKRVRRDEPDLNIKPLGAKAAFRKESIQTPSLPAASVTPVVSNQPSKDNLSQIIEQAMEDARRAQEEQVAKEEAAAAEEKRLAEEKAQRRQRAKEKAEKQKRHKEKGKDGSGRSQKPQSSNATHLHTNGTSSKDADKVSGREKQLVKLVGSVVVGYLSQWRTTFESSEEFKRHAKEITHKIAELEKQGRTYKSGAKIETLSDEKRAKIKSYVKSYVGKLSRPSPSKDPRKQAASHDTTPLPSVGSPEKAAVESMVPSDDEEMLSQDSGLDEDDAKEIEFEEQKEGIQKEESMMELDI